MAIEISQCLFFLHAGISIEVSFYQLMAIGYIF